MKVHLTYFKPSGKYYADGEYETSQERLFQIWEEVRGMIGKNLPGLYAGSKGWHILVSVPDHPFDHPHLIPAS